MVITSVRYTKERVSVHVFRAAAARSRQIARVLRSGGLPDAGAACQRPHKSFGWVAGWPPGEFDKRLSLRSLHSPLSNLHSEDNPPFCTPLHNKRRFPCTLGSLFARVFPFEDRTHNYFAAILYSFAFPA